MGFESFLVRLRGGSATFSQADDYVRRLPDAKPDADVSRTSGSTYYKVEDENHVIELR